MGYGLETIREDAVQFFTGAPDPGALFCEFAKWFLQHLGKLNTLVVDGVPEGLVHARQCIPCRVTEPSWQVGFYSGYFFVIFVRQVFTLFLTG